MNELEKWKSWLMGFEGWTGAFGVDDTDGRLDSCGLFPMGRQVIHRQEDVVGNRYLRCRSTCQLRYVTTVGQGAAFMDALAGWVQQQGESGSTPGLGDIAVTETVRAEKGRLQSRDAGGTATYCIDLIAEYTKVYKPENSSM